MMINRETYYKLHYIADYEWLSGNSMAMLWIRHGIRDLKKNMVK